MPWYKGCTKRCKYLTCDTPIPSLRNGLLNTVTGVACSQGNHLLQDVVEPVTYSNNVGACRPDYSFFWF